MEAEIPGSIIIFTGSISVPGIPMLQRDADKVYY